MKRFLALLMCVLMMVMAVSCTDYQYIKKYRQRGYLSEYKKAAGFLIMEEAPTGGKPFTAVNLNTYESDIDMLMSSLETVRKEFKLAWVGEKYVVFWNDETLTKGLLYTGDGKNSLERVETIYGDMDSIKINNKWYLIGHIYGKDGGE